MRILLVEDDLKIASFIDKGLDASGFTVDHVTDGEKGYDLALMEPYAAAIVDIMLPKLDGLELIGRMRYEKNNTPVIVLSARGSVDDRVKGLQTGGDVRSCMKGCGTRFNERKQGKTEFIVSHDQTNCCSV